MSALSVGDYERALRDEGLLGGPSPGGYWRAWLATAAHRQVSAQTIVEITRRQVITPDSFAVLAATEQLHDPDGRSFCLVPAGFSAEQLRAATLMTYLLNAGTGYGATSGHNDFPDTSYGAGEVARIGRRQRANAWSYVGARALLTGGGALATTPHGMLIGIGGNWLAGRFSRRGGTTYGDVFLVNLDHRDDPARRLRTIIASGVGWQEAGGQLRPGRLPLARLLHHEERHCRQWARLGPARMGPAYLAEELRAQLSGRTNRFEDDAGLADGGYR